MTILLICGVMVDDSDASHKRAYSYSSKPCSVSAHGQTYPVMYGQAPRNNPDDSMYPGDSFYLLVRFSTSPTYLGLDVAPLHSYDGLDVAMHNITDWRHVYAGWRYGGAGVGAEDNGGGYRPVAVAADPSEAGRIHPHYDLGRRPAILETTHYYATYGDGRHCSQSGRMHIQPPTRIG